MPSTSERALTALHARLSTLRGVDVRRNDPLKAAIQAGGMLNLLDGDPGEPEVTMSPLLYHYEHAAELDVVVNEVDRDRAFDALKVKVAGVLAADRTLGGLVDWLEAGAPAPVDLPFEGAAAIKAATIPIRLFYSTPDPLL